MEFFGGPPASGGCSLTTECFGGVDEDQEIAELIESGFEEQSGIEDNGVDLRWNVLQLLQDFVANSRADDLIERFAGGLLSSGVAEDEFGERGAMNFAGVGKYLRTEVIDEGVANVRQQELSVANLVGVDDLQLEAREPGDKG